MAGGQLFRYLQAYSVGLGLLGTVLAGLIGGIYTVGKPLFDEYVQSLVKEHRAESILASFRKLEPDVLHVLCDAARTSKFLEQSPSPADANRRMHQTLNDLSALLPLLERRVVDTRTLLESDRDPIYAEALDIIDGVENATRRAREIVPRDGSGILVPANRFYFAHLFDNFYRDLRPVLAHPLDMEKTCGIPNY